MGRSVAERSAAARKAIATRHLKMNVKLDKNLLKYLRELRYAELLSVIHLVRQALKKAKKK